MDFIKNYDVAVVGGGIAGVAAALASARQGKKTVLLEKTVILGGLATSGMILVYLPLCDGNGTQVTFGICEELIKLSLKYGPGEIPEWKSNKNSAKDFRYRCIFAPAALVLALDEVLEEAGVDIWLDTLVCGVENETPKHLSGVWVENKSGRGLVKAKCFVDASGDGEVARRAGAPYEEGENYLSLWAMQYNQNQELFGTSYKLSDNIGVFTTQNSDTYSGLDSKDISRFMIEGRRILRQFYQKEYASGKAARQSLYPISLPSMAQFRKIAGIKGHASLCDNQHAQYFEDSIGLVADWRKPGYVWEIPYGTLVPQNIKGVLTAGRCISSFGDAWEVTRVIPAAALSGEAAGIAAALSVEQGITPEQLDVKLLQKKLKESGGPLHLQDVGL